MSGVLAEVRRLNGLGAHALAEPFSGGAGASLRLLYAEETRSIHINDADRAIFDFWWAITERGRAFLDMLEAVPVTIDEWLRQREVYRSSRRVSRLERGFAAFYLNRCNRSGIIQDGSVIGGLEQHGVWKIDARFNRAALRSRLERVMEYRSRIRVSNLDGLEVLSTLDAASTFFFVDPPYFHKGPTLYLNSLEPAYHRRLAELLRSMPRAAWLVTYDDCPEIREMYEGWTNIRPFSLRYSASERRSGRELAITPKWMSLPEVQGSAAISW